MLHNPDNRCYQTEVFSSPLGPLEPKVSGVGLNHDPEYTFYRVPSGYDARWDDEGYQFPPTDELPLMRQTPVDGRHGFIFHAVCYSLLQEFFYPREVPVARLLEICKSCPFQYLGLSWGHDYGGIVCLENQYPWEDQDVDEVEQLELQHQRANPWNIPELKELLQHVHLGLPKKQKVNLTEFTPTDGGVLSNCFTRLPLEILGSIVVHLPTDEVRTLARTSKELAMFIPSGLEQSFWASRFQPPFELDFVFEVQKHRDQLDWRSLYFGMARVMRCSPGLRNRKRIWGLIRSPLSELTGMHWNGSLALRPLDANEDKRRWKEVCGSLQPLERIPGTSGFKAGCKQFYVKRTFIPTLLHQVVVSTIGIGNKTFITGLRFIPNEGSDVYLGYITEEKDSPLNRMDQFVDATGVQGFILAIGSRGIQALQIITCAGQSSQWFGCPDGLPKTCRLVTSKCITALEAGFDGFKMVSLAIAEMYPYLEYSADKAELLRDSALWFPEIPESHLYLNETCFTGIYTPTSQFRPLCYVLFGGSSVTDFQSLTKISVLSQGNCIMVIDFHYDTGNIRRLGYQRYQLSSYETSDFHIDGAQGEVIKTMEVDLDNFLSDHENVQSFWKHGRLRSVKMSTNRGRQEHLRGKRDSSEQPYSLKPMGIVPGTTLTGLYAGWDYIYGLISLGVISEFENR